MRHWQINALDLQRDGDGRATAASALERQRSVELPLDQGRHDRKTQTVDRRGTVVATTEGWKTRRLTYPIKGRNEGYYAVFAFKGTAKTLDSLDRAVRYDESVIRHMVLRKDEAKPAA